MIFNVSGSGGGAALNFRVVGGTTAPENPKENCIWVNTSTDITSYVFSATQPTGSAGMVWITIGTSSSVEFNALKKNGIQVYPLSAKQYVSGAWVNKEAKSYQGGKWVDWWDGYLYNYGVENVDVAGGIGISDAGAMTVTKNSNNITFTEVYSTAYNKRLGCCHANAMVNISDKKTLIAIVTTTKNGDGHGDVVVGVSKNLNDFIDITARDTMIGTKTTTAVTNAEIRVDISTLSGEYYLGVSAFAGVQTVHMLRVE